VANFVRLMVEAAGLAADGALEVTEVVGTEAISSPYEFAVTAVAALADVEAAGGVEALLAQSCRLEWDLGEEGAGEGSGGGAARAFAGKVIGAEALSWRHDAAEVTLRIVLGPALALLGMRRRSQIFQDMSAIDAIDAVLDEWQIARRWALREAYPRRPFVTQYEETDLDFVMRLLAEEGIFASFEQPEAGATAGEKLVFGDHEGAYGDILAAAGAPRARSGAPILAVAMREAAAGEAAITSLSAKHQLCPESVLLRDYDFRRPRHVASGFSQVRSAAGRGGWMFYDHRDQDELDEHVDADVGDARARRRLEQLRAAADVFSGEGTCRALGAGQRFALEGHAWPKLDGDYVVTRVEHRAVLSRRAGEDAPPGYRCQFDCAPAHARIRPAMPARRVVQSLETATVSGPEGEEIWTDAYGRIQVRFHWDLRARGDNQGRTSCWLRLAEAWAGAGWGTQSIPRVGMEVIVGFAGGDPDRPLVLGCIRNAETMPAFALPEDATRSGLRTASSPGGGGFNELSFEDRKGAEQVYLRAERDLEELVQNDQRSRVIHDRLLAVEHDRMAVVGNDDQLVVGNNKHTHVKGEYQIVAERGLHANVTGGASTVVSGPNAMQSGGPLTIECSAASITSEGDATLAAGGNISLDAGGKISINAAGPVVIHGSMVHVTGDGMVTVDGGSVTVNGGVISLN
jgi:type VI secretion system secreted protein VgrG